MKEEPIKRPLLDRLHSAAAREGIVMYPDGVIYVSNHEAIDRLMVAWGLPPASTCPLRRQSTKVGWNEALAMQTDDDYLLLIFFLNHPNPADNGYSMYLWPKATFTREQANLRCFERLTSIKMDPGETVFFPVKQDATP